MSAKASLTGPILFAAVSVIVGVTGLLDSRAAWLRHSVVWVSGGRGAPHSWLPPLASVVLNSLFILVGVVYLIAAIAQRKKAR